MGWFFALFSLPFIGIGLGLLFAPLHAFAKQRHAVHAITNERIMTVYSKPFAATESYAASKLTFLHRQDLRDNRGSLRIGYGTDRDSDGDIRRLEVTWTAVKDARRAELAILELMRPGK